MRLLHTSNETKTGRYGGTGGCALITDRTQRALLHPAWFGSTALIEGTAGRCVECTTRQGRDARPITTQGLVDGYHSGWVVWLRHMWWNGGATLLQAGRGEQGGNIAAGSPLLTQKDTRELVPGDYTSRLGSGWGRGWGQSGRGWGWPDCGAKARTRTTQLLLYSHQN